MEPIKKTSGDLLLDQGALFGRMLGQAEYLAVRPTKEGCATLAKLVLELARAIGIGHLLDPGKSE